MRILMVTPDPTPGGGVATSARRIQRSLQGSGHRVQRMFPEACRFPGDEVDEGGAFRHAPLDLPALTDLVVRRSVNFDKIIGFYGGCSGISAVAAATSAGLPSVLALRGNDLDRDFLLQDRHALLRWAIERATAVATVSVEAAAKVRAWTDREACVVGNGVNLERFRPVSGESFRQKHGLSGRVVGMFGELKAKRGVEVLQELPGWRVLIVGRVRAEVEHLVPTDAVVLPWVEPEALPEAYAAADVVLQPSHHDGLPNVVLEAMACARPVVARPVGGMPDVIEHGRSGFLVQDNWAKTCEQAARSDVGAAARRSVPTLQVELERWNSLLSAAE